jgi:hypothetical protein
MTRERRLLIEPADIERLEFVCRNCRASQSINPANEKHFVPRKCHNCGEDLYSADSPLHQASTNLFRAIRAFAEMKDGAKLELRMQIHDPEEKH